MARIWVAAGAIAALAGAVAVISQTTPKVEMFSPTGAIARVEQIKVRFATPMVAFGDPRLPAPLSGNCSDGATGRWTDARSYAIDLPTPLAGGRRCSYSLNVGLKDASGALVGGQRQFVFSTGGPSIRFATPQSGAGDIEEDQAFLLALNAAPIPASVAAHAACLIDGVGEAVPIDILPDADRDKVLNGAKSDWRVQATCWSGRAGKRPNMATNRCCPRRPSLPSNAAARSLRAARSR